MEKRPCHELTVLTVPAVAPSLPLYHTQKEKPVPGAADDPSKVPKLMPALGMVIWKDLAELDKAATLLLSSNATPAPGKGVVEPSYAGGYPAFKAVSVIPFPLAS
jgi:hypothetical protein